MSSNEKRDFIRTMVQEDLQSGKRQSVVTRFPPEPNGYLHIGHAKSICLNFGLAKEFGGKCHLRFDDTNPLKESKEYVRAIQDDVRWLGFDWGDNCFFASDYFEQLYELAEKLISKGLAYVESASDEEVRELRGTVTEPGRPSKYRDRSVEENLDLFRRMRAGEFEDGAHVLRAKIDLAAPNMKMRDPPIYRIRHAHHHNTGDAWCIYPLYDFTHGQSDWIEGITYSLCTLEFENNRELYNWFLDALVDEPHPKQTEFAKLKLSYILLGKRNMITMVNEGIVEGWDDPRMPTIAGYRRRGYPASAIRTFCDRVGVAKANSTVDITQLEHTLRDELNFEAPRVMAVLDPVELVIDNYPEGQSEELEASFWPDDVPKKGHRKVAFGRRLFIERDDFKKDPPKKFFRMAPGREIRLRYAYLVTCTSVEEDAEGNVVRIHASYDPATRGGTAPDGRKVKGTLHWVDADNCLDATVRLYDRLFSVESPGGTEGVDFRDELNPNSLKVLDAKLEAGLKQAKPEERFQFERQGYFYVDPVDSKDGAPVFHRIVPLKDSWNKAGGKSGAGVTAAVKGSSRKPGPPAATISYAEADAKSGAKSAAKSAAKSGELSPEAKALVDGHKIPEDQARTIAADPRLLAVWNAAAGKTDASTLASLLANEVSGLVGQGNLAFDADALVELIALQADGKIQRAATKEVLSVLATEGGRPAAIVEARGLATMNDASALSDAIAGVLEANPEETARFKAGEAKLMGFFVGQAMKATGKAADPKAVRAELKTQLEG